MDDNQLIKYSNASQVISQSGSIESNCNGITFINIGTDTATVLGYPILQGQSLYLPGNVGEKDVTNYSVMFAGASTNQQLLVIRKLY